MPRTGCRVGIGRDRGDATARPAAAPRALAASISADLLLDELRQVLDDVLVLEAVIGHAGDIDLMRAVAAAGEADVGLARLAGAVDDAADDRERDRRRDVGEALLERRHGLDDVELLARAGRARDHGDAAPAQLQRLQDLVADPDLLDRVRRERDADGVADPGPEQHAHPDRGFDRAAHQDRPPR